MPCYQTQTCSCELNNADQELLEKALVEEGYRAVSNARNKTLTFSKQTEQGAINGNYDGKKLNFSAPQGVNVDTDAIKRGYSKEAIKAKAKKHGFKVTAKPGNRYILTKIASRM